MRKGLLGTIPALLAGAGLAMAQPPAEPQPNSADVSARPAVAAPAESPRPAPIFRAVGYDPDNAFNEPPESPYADNAFIPCPEVDVCRPCFWANLEYLLWFVRNDTTPQLLTTSPSGLPGLLNGPDTQIVAGQSQLAPTTRNGARVTVGGWLEEGLGLPVGIEGTAFITGKRALNSTFTSSTAGSPVLSRPFTNALNNAQSVYFVSAPNQFSGTFQLSTYSELYGAELNTVWQPGLINEFPDVLIGFRWVDLNEGISASQRSLLLANGLSAFPPARVIRRGNTIALMDTFDVSNNFYGGQIGMRYEYDIGRFYLNWAAKLAIGSTTQTARINGSSTLITPTTSTTVGGGLLALPTNIGDRTQTQFSLMPEVAANLGFTISRNYDIHVGYSFLYWSRVIRPSSLIDTRLNPTQIPTSIQNGPLVGPANPNSQFVQKDFWVNGLNAGLTIKY